MKRFLLLLLSFWANTCFTQIDQGYWLIGGVGSLRSGHVAPDGLAEKYTKINLAGNFGYFLTDKLAVGLRPGFSLLRYTHPSNFRISNLKISPFIRWYLLDKEQDLNILLEPKVGWGWEKTNLEGSKVHPEFSYSFAAGPVIFIREVVAVELTLAYTFTNYKETGRHTRSFDVGLGLQIHLKSR